MKWIAQYQLLMIILRLQEIGRELCIGRDYGTHLKLMI